MSTVTGKIIVPSKAPKVSATRAAVRVRDVTYADSAELVAERTMVVNVAPGVPIDFRIDVPDDKMSAGLTLNLEVHIDLDGSGYFSPGDLVSRERHRILANTHHVDVPVSLV